MSAVARFVNPSDNEVYQRLLSLQEEYKKCKKKKEMENNKHLFIKRKPIVPIIPKQKKSKYPMNPETLAICMKHIILKHGGIAHAETLVEYIKKYYPSCHQYDCTPLTLEDIKLEAIDVLHERTDLFEEQANGWSVDINIGEISNKDKVIPLVNKIIEIIESEDGSCRFKIIIDKVYNEWIPPIFRNKQPSKEDIKEAVYIILETNPKFHYDTNDPDQYCLPLYKKSKRRVSSEHSTPINTKIQEDSPQIIENDPLEPPTGFICACGATTPGKTAAAKWRIDVNGVFKCISCFNKRPSSKPQPKKKRKTSHNSSSDPSGPWIQCDRCHSWVMAHNDNIADISIYDDSNPNHLDYFCPDCRSKQSSEPRKSLRRRTKRE